MRESRDPNEMAGVAQDIAPLAWVIDEIRSSLNHALGGIRTFLASKQDIDALRAARNQVHQTNGALQLLDLRGVSLLTEAIERLLRQWEEQPRQCQPQAARTVDTAVAAVLAYLDGLLSGRPNQPIRLFPYYRDILQLTGAPRIHPADLVFPDLSRRPALHNIEIRPIAPEQLRQRRARYEEGLLGFLRNSEDPRARRQMRDALADLEHLPARGIARSFWWVVRGLLDALDAQQVPVDVDLKRVLARLNLQLRRLIEDGGAVAERLMTDTLYYVGRADERVARVAEVRRLFGLDALMPPDFERPTLTAIDPEALRTLKEAMAQAKPLWIQQSSAVSPDLTKFLHELQVARLAAEALSAAPIARVLERIAAFVSDRGPQVAHVRDALGLEVAAALLFVELGVDELPALDQEYEERASAVIRRLEAARRGVALPEAGAWESDLARRAQDRLTMGAVVAETQTTLRAIEERLDRFFRNPAARDELAETAPMFEQVRGVLSMLGYEEPVAALRGVQQAVAGFANPATPPHPEEFARIAQNLGALGFFVETLDQEPDRPRAMFRYDPVAGLFSADLGRPAQPEGEHGDDLTMIPPPAAPAKEAAAAPAAGAASAAPAPAVVPAGRPDVLETKVTERLALAHLLARRLEQVPTDAGTRQALGAMLPLLDNEADLLDDAALKGRVRGARQALAQLIATPVKDVATRLVELFAPPQAPATPAPTAPMPASEAAADRELLDIFIDEAREVLAAVETGLADVRRAPDDAASLTVVRRAFHTLKGSSRMVGLKNFGEGAWAVEQCFNLWLAQERPATEDLIELAAAAHRLMVSWIDRIAVDPAVALDVAPLVHAAQHVREGGAFAYGGSLPPREPERGPKADGSTAGGAPAVLPVPVAAPVPPPATAPAVVAAPIPPAPAPTPAPTLPPGRSTLEFLGEAPLLPDDIPAPPPAPRDHDLVADLNLAAVEPVDAPLGLDDDRLPVMLDLDHDILGDGASGPDVAADETPEVLFDLLPPLDPQPPAHYAFDLGAAAGRDAAPAAEPQPAPPGAAAPIAAAEPWGFDGELVPVEPEPRRAPEPPEPEASSLAASRSEETRRIGPIEISHGLYSVFLSESDECVRTLLQDVSEWRYEPHRPPSRNATRRAHSLAGISATVGLRPVWNIADPFDDLLTELSRLAVGSDGEPAGEPLLSPQQFDVLERVIERVRGMLHVFAAGLYPNEAPLEAGAIQDMLRVVRAQQAWRAGDAAPGTHLFAVPPAPVAEIAAPPSQDEAPALGEDVLADLAPPKSAVPASTPAPAPLPPTLMGVPQPEPEPEFPPPQRTDPPLQAQPESPGGPHAEAPFAARPVLRPASQPEAHPAPPAAPQPEAYLAPPAAPQRAAPAELQSALPFGPPAQPEPALQVVAAPEPEPRPAIDAEPPAPAEPEAIVAPLASAEPAAGSDVPAATELELGPGLAFEPGLPFGSGLHLEPGLDLGPGLAPDPTPGHAVPAPPSTAAFDAARAPERSERAPVSGVEPYLVRSEPREPAVDPEPVRPAPGEARRAFGELSLVPAVESPPEAAREPLSFADRLASSIGRPAPRAVAPRDALVVPDAPAGSAAPAAPKVANPPAPEDRVVAPDIPEAAPAADELDPDLLPVFVTEAQDLLPAIGSQLRLLAANPNDREAARDLMRRLHTFKGSARMAGAMSLGDLAHDMEARIESAMQLVNVPSVIVDDLQTQFDRVQSRFESVQGGHAEAAPPAAADVGITPGYVPPGVPAPALGGQPPLPLVDALAGAIDRGQLRDPAPTLLGAGAAAAATGAATPAALPFVRVRADILDKLVDHAGEVAISRSKLENEVGTLKSALGDLTENIGRLRTQLREVEIQADAQIQARADQLSKESAAFDPLEFDRYSRLQELTRLLAESVEDVAMVQSSMQRDLQSADNDLTAQSRLTRDLQQQLMRVRLVPFANVSERLYRVARQTAKEVGKRINLEIRGGTTEIDRSVLERMAAPFEHLLRNSIVHGLESPHDRVAANKPETGELLLEVSQEGNEIVVVYSDDGAGLNLERIRQRGIEKQMLGANQQVTERELVELIFAPGFSTATEVTELAGRGVGMDVVRSELSSFGGRIAVATEAGRGTRFTLYLPLTLAVTQVVLATVGKRRFAIPAGMVEQVKRFRSAWVEAALRDGVVDVEPFGTIVVRTLAQLLNEELPASYPKQTPLAVLRSGEDRLGVVADEISASQEVVVKNVGIQVSRLAGVLGATILGTGEIVLIVNPVQLIARAPEPPLFLDAAAGAGQGGAAAGVADPDVGATILVVDDSLTVRRVTQRLLERHGYHVVLAKDGVEALRKIQEGRPDLMLVDIEMPRMDGFDLARNIRSNAVTRGIPIIIITSRTAEKHRRVAFEIGVNEYLGKPYRDEELLELIRRYLGLRTPA